ncbi:hypothetical protein [Jannaschia aquimarina]|uniref:Uncharacterized protein n=1 Tax=Jannaschia aquimarina TaxID=935700 RepID=A0A0D1EGF4_9RHOB|nr:hypothetical protein [Jannaschia aquimarina]KIT16729.1 hypothetical protein jaqu_15170 [Jannaschia aquimarina]SNS53757.1 hypothetical protein SAMN05421775_101361 [Jannaschia aquimarina]
MVSYDVEEHGDRLVITLDPGEPVGLQDLADSFASLARMYERHYRQNDEAAPKLFVTRLETGSVIAEIAPFGLMMGGIAMMDGGMIVTDFANRVWRGITYFTAGREGAQKLEAPSRADAADLKEFVKPLTGKTGARLGIRHAKYERAEGEKRTVIEYTFDEAEINKASIKMDQAIALPTPSVAPDAGESGIRNEVMLFLEQANRGRGKEKGRTGDKGRIPEVSDKVLPVYFRQSIQDIKEQVMQGEENPLNLVFVVDVHVQRIDGEPKGYTVVEIHESTARES